jgi:hypothetical protein
MYRWYKMAKVCFVYLSDYQWNLPGGARYWEEREYLGEYLDLRDSRWITRGWTLQELIAPKKVKFYDSRWTYIGDKKGNLQFISLATGINWEVLRTGDLSGSSVAQRMSWASSRKCTRIEDVAYSLMGIFNINMPMLYGEGENAFLRLQEEIIKTTFDQSIFAWVDQDPGKVGPSVHRGLLARSPQEFASCRSIVTQPTIHYSVPYSVTNLGLFLETALMPMQLGSEEIYLAPLKDTTNFSLQVAILLKRLVPTSNQFARVSPHLVEEYDRSRESIDTSEKIYVKQNQLIPQSYFSSSIYGFRIIPKTTGNIVGTRRYLIDVEVRRVWPASQWSQDQRLLRAQTGTQKTLAAIWFDKFGDLALLISFEPGTLEKHFEFVRTIAVGIEDEHLEKAVGNALVGARELKSFKDGTISDIVHDGFKGTAAGLKVAANLWEDRVILELTINIS